MSKLLLTPALLLPLLASGAAWAYILFTAGALLGLLWARR